MLMTGGWMVVKKMSLSWAALALATAGSLGACAAVFPELSTPYRQVSEQSELEPRPPEDLYFIRFESASVPAKTPGGTDWPRGGPDPFAKLIVDGVDVLVTSVAPRTRKPSWPDQPFRNYRILNEAVIYVEVWDRNANGNLPICRERIRDLAQMRDGGSNEIWCDSGARAWLSVEPARGLRGLGLYYETRGADGVRVTRVIGLSPAARAGIRQGDRILAIAGKKVAEMDPLQIQSEMNLHSRTGVKLDVWFKNGKRHLVTLKEAAVYPLGDEGLKLPR